MHIATVLDDLWRYNTRGILQVPTIIRDRVYIEVKFNKVLDGSEEFHKIKWNIPYEQIQFVFLNISTL